MYVYSIYTIYIHRYICIHTYMCMYICVISYLHMTLSIYTYIYVYMMDIIHARGSGVISTGGSGSFVVSKGRISYEAVWMGKSMGKSMIYEEIHGKYLFLGGKSMGKIVFFGKIHGKYRFFGGKSMGKHLINRDFG